MAQPETARPAMTPFAQMIFDQANAANEMYAAGSRVSDETWRRKIRALAGQLGRMSDDANAAAQRATAGSDERCEQLARARAFDEAVLPLAKEAS